MLDGSSLPDGRAENDLQHDVNVSSIQQAWGAVSGDFVRTGGMDIANLRLLEWLSRRTAVMAVAHRVDDSLSVQHSVRCRLVSRPFGKPLLGRFALARAGRDEAKSILDQGGRFVANGGNCDAGDINWVHYVHAAHTPVLSDSVLRRAKFAVAHRHALYSEKRAIQNARVVVCNSLLTARHVQEHFSVSESRMRVVYYGIDSDCFLPASVQESVSAKRDLSLAGRPWAVFIGGMGDRRKGFDLLFDAWEQLCSDGSWDVGLMVVGRGSEAKVWEARAKASGLDEHIRFLGFRTDIPRILTASDLLVHPARYEAYGLGVHEALCSGVPAIVTDACGVAERYADDWSRFVLTTPLTADVLASALRAWRLDMEAIREQAHQFAVKLRRHTWEHSCGALVEAVQSV